MPSSGSVVVKRAEGNQFSVFVRSFCFSTDPHPLSPSPYPVFLTPSGAACPVYKSNLISCRPSERESTGEVTYLSDPGVSPITRTVHLELSLPFTLSALILSLYLISSNFAIEVVFRPLTSCGPRLPRTIPWLSSMKPHRCSRESCLN